MSTSLQLIRCSKLPLLTKCPGSLFLPHLEGPESEELATANAWGHMVHKWKETGEYVGPNRRAENALRKSVRLSGINRLALWPSGGSHEQSVAVRVDGTRTAIVRAGPDDLSGIQELHRWITGTADFWWSFDVSGELWVDDLKTGKWYDDAENPGTNRYPQDPSSTQLRCYALAISRVLSYTGVVHVSITHWPRIPLSRRHAMPVRYWTSYTTDELDDFWGDLERLWRDGQAEAHERLEPGSHCRFCPSKPFCLVAEPDPPPYNWRDHV